MIDPILNGFDRERINCHFHDVLDCNWDYLEVLKTNYKIWPAVQAINFTFVPLHLRIVTVNIIAIFWNTYLAFISGRSPTEELLEEQLHTD